MAKGKSFAEKASKAKKKVHHTMVKYVRSVVSEKTGHYRFQETMLKIPEGMDIDGYLKKLAEEEKAPEEPAAEAVGETEKGS